MTTSITKYYTSQCPIWKINHSRYINRKEKKLRVYWKADKEKRKYQAIIEITGKAASTASGGEQREAIEVIRTRRLE